MSYIPALGDFDTILDMTKSVVEDPCLVPVTQMVLRLYDLEQKRRKPAAKPAQPAKPGQAPAKPTPTPAKPAAPTAPVRPAKGVGLCHAVTPLKVLLWVQEHRWVVPVGALAIVGGLVGAGYLAGRGTR